MFGLEKIAQIGMGMRENGIKGLSQQPQQQKPQQQKQLTEIDLEVMKVMQGLESPSRNNWLNEKSIFINNSKSSYRSSTIYFPRLCYKFLIKILLRLWRRKSFDNLHYQQQQQQHYQNHNHDHHQQYISSSSSLDNSQNIFDLIYSSTSFSQLPPPPPLTTSATSATATTLLLPLSPPKLSPLTFITEIPPGSESEAETDYEKDDKSEQQQQQQQQLKQQQNQNYEQECKRLELTTDALSPTSIYQRFINPSPAASSSSSFLLNNNNFPQTNRSFDMNIGCDGDEFSFCVSSGSEGDISIDN